jgi:YD repeat-containing protein
MKSRENLPRSLVFAVAVILATSLAREASAGVTYAYDALGRLASATYDNGVIIYYYYDEDGNRLTQVVQANAAAAVWNNFYWGSGAQWGAASRQQHSRTAKPRHGRVK